MIASASLLLSGVLDLLFEEPPGRVHPVALFGRVVERVDRPWTYPRAVGSLAALCLPLAAATLAGALIVLASQYSPLLGMAVAAIALFTTVSLRMLVSVATVVVERIDADPERARDSISALVGRETSALSAGELRSAAVESAAENLSDGLVAPLFAFAIGSQYSLSVAVAAAVWVKAVNTMDSMLGYPSKPVGWASARLDDVVMYVPARLSALLLAVAGRSPGALVRARSGARATPSPNSGWPMATLAVVLGVELSKPGTYVLNPDGALPTAEQAHRGIRVVAVAGALSFLVTGAIAWV